MTDFIVLGGPKDLLPGDTDPMQAYLAWRDDFVAEHGEQRWEDYMNGFCDEEGNPAEESLLAEQEAANWFAERDRYYGNYAGPSNSLC